MKQAARAQTTDMANSLSETLEDGFRLYLRGLGPTLFSTLLFTVLGAGAAAFIGEVFLLPLYDIIASRFVNAHPDLLPADTAAYLYGSAAALLLFLLLLSFFESLNLRHFVRLARGETATGGSFDLAELKRGPAFFAWMLLYILVLAGSLLPLLLVILYPPQNLLLGLLLVTLALVPLFYVTVTFTFGPNSVIQDEIGPLRAFARNLKLVSPHWWRTLSFVMIAYTAVHSVIAVCFVIVLVAFAILDAGSLRELTGWVRLFLIALGYGTFIGGVLSLPMYNALLVVFYNDLKSRSGTDVHGSLN